MSERAAYSRVYWSVVDDPKFSAIYDDDRHLATWLRLLLIADQAHPASANVPIGTNRRSVVALAEAGLIDLGTGSRYRIHGLDAERERRRQAATRRFPTGTQLGPERDPAGIQTPGLRRDETRRDEITPPPPVGRRKDGTNPRALGSNPRATGTSPKQEREKQKRGPSSLHQILSDAAKAF